MTDSGPLAPAVACAADNSYKPVCLEMSNTHLLKVDTFDQFMTASALKKLIASTCPPPLTGDTSKGEPLFDGMLRCSKNPKSANMYFSFATAEQREHAKTVLTTHMKHRKHQLWVEVPVTERDLQMTYRGAQTTNSSNEGANQQQKDESNNNDNPGSLSNRAIKRQAREGDERTSNTAQWAAYPYEVQISKKAAHCKGILKQIASGRIQRLVSKYSCQILVDGLKVIESPYLSGYRNHVNFTCGYDSARRPVIGFVAGSVLAGHVAVEDVTGRWTESETSSSSSKAPPVPLTTNPLSVAYAKAIMKVVEVYEKYTFEGTMYKLGMLDKGTQALQDNVDGETAMEAPNDAEEGEKAAKRSPRPEVTTTTTAVTHPFWRRVQVRHSTVGDVMVDLEVDPSTLPNELVSSIKQDLVSALQQVERSYDGVAAEEQENQAYSKGSAETNDFNEKSKPDSHRVVSAIKRPSPLIIPSCRLVSLQWHFHSGTTMCPHEAPRETLFGESTLMENLCGMKFLLSPPSFFQVNTPTTEKMLDRVAEVAELKPTTTLLDLCCGTGIIGICLSKYVKKIVGIEMVASAIENAKVNAANNNVTEKTTYYAAKVEDALNQAMSTLTPEEKSDIVAIFDPPRAGMHPSVLAAVRNIPQIRRIVYISCDQQALIRDCPSLMKEPTKKFRGTPYVIDGSFGIDLFPHTPHVEMVVVLNKVTNEEMQRYYDNESRYRVKEADTETPAVEKTDETA